MAHASATAGATDDMPTYPARKACLLVVIHTSGVTPGQPGCNPRDLRPYITYRNPVRHD